MNVIKSTQHHPSASSKGSLDKKALGIGQGSMGENKLPYIPGTMSLAND
jgi:hypothetical protein